MKLFLQNLIWSEFVSQKHLIYSLGSYFNSGVVSLISPIDSNKERFNKEEKYISFSFILAGDTYTKNSYFIIFQGNLNIFLFSLI